MSKEDRRMTPREQETPEKRLQRHLAEIEREETPERLLDLARELQRLLRRPDA